MRLIDADELKEDLKQKVLDNCIYGQNVKALVQGLMDRSIDNQPTIDPVKHGRWIGMNSCYANKYETLFFYQCSECQQEVDEYGIDNYCSHCGAKMDGEVNA